MTSGVFARLYVPIVVVATPNCVRITFRLYIYGDHEKLNFRNGIVTQKSRRSMELKQVLICSKQLLRSDALMSLCLSE